MFILENVFLFRAQFCKSISVTNYQQILLYDNNKKFLPLAKSNMILVNKSFNYNEIIMQYISTEQDYPVIFVLDSLFLLLKLD